MNYQQIAIAYTTIVRKEIHRFIRIWSQTLLPPVITMTLYFIIFGDLMGERIGLMDGHPYIDFVVPGLVMMTIITSAYSNVVSSFFGAKFQRFVEEILVSPTPNIILLLGVITGGVARALCVAVVAVMVAWFFTDLQITHYWITLGIVLTTAILFSLAGFINALFAKTFDDIAIIPTFVLMPLTYLGGVFYSINLLSDFWGNISKLNPILYIVNVFRYGVLGISDINVYWALFTVVAITVVTFAYCLYLLNSGKCLRS